MELDPAAVLARVQSRKGGAWKGGMGIGVAVGHFAVMLPCLDDDKCDIGYGLGIDPDRWAAAVKEASNKLVYSDDSMLVTGTKGSGMESGESGVIEATEKSIMDFHGVITSTREDRDKDTMECSGAEIDPKHPLLAYHNPIWPIGRFVKEVGRTKDVIRGHYAIADTVMGRDMAVLIEFKAVRLSQGFIPKKATEKANGGLHITAYETVECSGVSVPSNKDAIVTAHQRGKLFHPVNKFLAAEIRAAMPDLVVGGYDPAGKNAPDPAPDAGHKSCGCVKGDKGFKASPKISGKGLGVCARQGYDGTFWIGVSLADSWEWVADELEEAAGEFLRGGGVKVPYDSSVALVGTFSDSAVLAVMPSYGEGEATFYRCSWSSNGGEPAFTGTPEAVELEVAVTAGDDAVTTGDKSVTFDLCAKRVASHVMDKMKRAKELANAVRTAPELSSPTRASAESAHKLVSEVVKASRSKKLSASLVEKLSRSRELLAAVKDAAELKAPTRASAEAAHRSVCDAVTASGGKSIDASAEDCAAGLCQAVAAGARLSAGCLAALEEAVSSRKEADLSEELLSALS